MMAVIKGLCYQSTLELSSRWTIEAVEPVLLNEIKTLQLQF